MAGRQKPTTGPITPHRFEPFGPPLELRCGACGQKGQYAVGRLFVDPTRLGDDDDMEELNQAFGFTNYFHCQRCGAGGPWELTSVSSRTLRALLLEAEA